MSDTMQKNQRDRIKWVGHILCILNVGPSVLRAPAEQTKVATVLGN